MLGLAENDTMVGVEETDNAASKIVGSVRYNLANTKHPIESVNVVLLADLITQFRN